MKNRSPPVNDTWTIVKDELNSNTSENRDNLCIQIYDKCFKMFIRSMHNKNISCNILILRIYSKGGGKEKYSITIIFQKACAQQRINWFGKFQSLRTFIRIDILWKWIITLAWIKANRRNNFSTSNPIYLGLIWLYQCY